MRELKNESLTAGRHEAIWDGRDMYGRRASGGIYFIRMESGPRVKAQRVVLTH